MYRLVYKPLPYDDYQVQKKVFFNLFWKTVYRSWHQASANRKFETLVNLKSDNIEVLREYP